MNTTTRLTDAGLILAGELVTGGVWCLPENVDAVVEALEEFEESGIAESRQVTALVALGAVIIR